MWNFKIFNAGSIYWVDFKHQYEQRYGALTYSHFNNFVLGFMSFEAIGWNYEIIEYFFGSMKNDDKVIFFKNKKEAEEFIDKVNAYLLANKLEEDLG